MTEAERRGVLLVVGLLLLGAAWDGLRAMVPGPDPAAPARTSWPADTAAPESTVTVPPSPSPVSEVLDLNRATAEELDRLPGVGPVLARRIIEHRLLHGPFHAVDELLAVRGIGARLLERLRPHLRTDPN